MKISSKIISYGCLLLLAAQFIFAAVSEAAPKNTKKPKRGYSAPAKQSEQKQSKTNAKELPKAEAENAGGNADYSHNLVLSPYTSLPSYVIFRFKKEKPLMVRGLFTLDGRLLVVPLSYRLKSNDFRASFPTPSESLEYQFQAVFSDGEMQLSEKFTSESRCALHATEALVSKANGYPLQNKMISLALWLDEELSQLKYAIFLSETLAKEAP